MIFMKKGLRMLTEFVWFSGCLLWT